MMTASCPGFLDRYGNWNNGKKNLHFLFYFFSLILGFDCSLSRVCCGTETDRYCCTLSTSSSTSQLSSSSSLDDSVFNSSDTFLSEKWFFFQMCIIGLFLTIAILIFIMIYQCLTSMRRNKHHHQQQQQRMSFIQVPLPSASPLLIQHSRSISNRISTISCATSDIKSRCLDTSIVLNTPLNLYPTSNSSSSTSTASSSYYMFPNELEQLCK